MLKKIWKHGASLTAMVCVLLCIGMLFSFAAAEETYAVTVEEVTESFAGGLSNDAAAEGYISRIMKGQKEESSGLVSRGTLAGDKLTGNDKKVYDLLKPLIAQVAAGKRTSTVFNIPLKTFLTKSKFTASELGLSTFTKTTIEAAQNTIIEKWCQVDYGRVHLALLADCPYELYWYDKTAGIQPAIGLGRCSYYDGGTDLTLVDYDSYSFTVTFYAAKEYSKDNTTKTTEVDSSWGTSVSAAAKNARQIVTNNAGMSDLDKLVAYKEKICELTDYNKSAADKNTSTPYGNPWQMIWVFDGDSSTKVVCEGYSKAFQFLCDESKFQGNIRSLIATGYMNAEAHMWNVVRMEDGKNYLVDVTNSDTGSVRQNGGLFLVGYSSSSSNKTYTYKPSGTEITYTYDDAMFTTYDSNALTMSNTDYTGLSKGWYIINGGLYIDGTGMIENALILPKNTTKVEAEAFQNGKFEAVVFQSVCTVASDAFTGCTNLKYVYAPNGSTIPGDAFPGLIVNYYDP